jgi:glutaminase
MYGLALEDLGREKTLTRVGVEPTGDPFNSIIKLDQDSHRPHNPMVNAGAIATAGLIQGKDLPERVSRMLDVFERYCGQRPEVDIAVYTSEKSTGHRNRALAHLMRNFDMIDERIDDILDLYFQQCSLLVSAQDLAMMGATLANGGVNPLSGAQALQPEYIQDVLSVMYTCGMYDYAGQWAYDVGLPAKSGVGGGICVVVPGVMGIGLFSPRLDAKGNSVRGVKACETMSRDLGLHVLGAGNKSKLMELLPELRPA